MVKLVDPQHRQDGLNCGSGQADKGAAGTWGRHCCWEGAGEGQRNWGSAQKWQAEESPPGDGPILVPITSPYHLWLC